MIQIHLKRHALAAAVGLATLFLVSGNPTKAAADPVKTYTTTSAGFDDVLFEFNNAIVDNGIKLETNGKVAAMLKRTGADVGSTKEIYKHAEYFSFCSAKLSRQMMEADPANLAHCPFVMFIYVSAAKPNEVVVGYKTHPKTGSPASIKAFRAVDSLLDKIAKQVVE